MQVSSGLKITTTATVLVTSLIWFHAPIFSGFDGIHGDLADGRLVLLSVEHSYQFILGDWIKNFWASPWNFHPFQLSTAMTETMAGNVLLYAPFRLSGLAMEHSFQAMIVFTSIANFFAMYCFAKLMKFNWLSCTTAAFIFAFSLIRQNQLNHLQLLPQFNQILALCCFVLLFRSKSAWHQLGLGVLLGSLLGWQGWSSMHLLWFFCFGALVTLGICLFIFGPKTIYHSTLKSWPGISAAALSFAATFYPLYYKFAEFADFNGAQRSLKTIVGFMPKFTNYIYPGNFSSWNWEWLENLTRAHIGIADESCSFTGMMALFAFFYSGKVFFKEKLYQRENLSSNRDLLAAISFVLFLVIMLVSTRDGLGRQIWPVIMNLIPGADGIRALSRIAFLQLIPLALFVAYLVHRCSGKSFKAKILTVLIASIVYIENFKVSTVAYSIEENRLSLSQTMKQWNQSQPLESCAVIFSRKATKNERAGTQAMWISLTKEIPTVNGYSGYLPPHYELHNDPSIENIQSWYQRNNLKVPNEKEICVYE